MATAVIRPHPHAYDQEDRPVPVKKVRYAVVGLGHIAQAAVLPAFRHARINSQRAP